ncbi:MAG: hypothetical protein QME45_13335 [Clostridiales bacterium]|nr:hypothetical protein [Clostridiales bacterium]
MKISKILRSKLLAWNIALFLLLSIIISFICAKIPRKIFSYKRWIFRERKWEKSGAVYQKIFRVRAWKRVLPELSDFIKSIMPKKYIKEFSSAYLSKYIMESCRAEFTHWNIIISSFVFSLWCDLERSMMMVTIAVVLNMPYIIIQRYNRPRVIRFMKQIECFQ